LKRILFSLFMCVAFWTPELVLFCFCCMGSSFAFCVRKKKESFSSACVYSTTRAICLAISSNSFFKSGKSEFLRKSQLKSTQAKRERERERERERKRRKRPAIEIFSTYSIKWWQQLSRNARFRNCSRSKFALQLWVARLLRQNDARFISSETYVEWVLFLFFPLSLPRQNHSTTGLLGTSVLSSLASNDNTSSSSFFFPLLH